MPSRKEVVEHCRMSLSHSVAQVKDRIDASQNCHTPEPLEDFDLPQICGKMEEQKTKKVHAETFASASSQCRIFLPRRCAGPVPWEVSAGWVRCDKVTGETNALVPVKGMKNIYSICDWWIGSGLC